MTKEVYNKLTPNEQLMYNEFSAFAARLAERQEEICELLKTILAEANE